MTEPVDRGILEVIDKIEKGPTIKRDDGEKKKMAQKIEDPTILYIDLIPLNCTDYVKITQNPKRVGVCK